MSEGPKPEEQGGHLYKLKKVESAYKKEIKRLTEENNILEEALDGIPDIIGIQKPDHTVVRYNKTGCEAVQKSQEEVIGQPCYSLLGKPVSCEDCATHLALKSKKLETIERFIPELNRYFICRSSPVLDDSGNVSHIIEQLHDITHRKQLETEKDHLIAQLQSAISEMHSQALYKMLAERISEGVIIGYENRIVYANPAALSILKRGEDELYRIQPKTLIHNDHIKSYETMIQGAHKGKSQKEFELCCLDSNSSEIWIQANCRPLEWEKEEGILITFMDITRQREKRLVAKKETSRLKKENRLLRSKHIHPYGLAHLVGTSDVMQDVYDKIINAIPIDENVIIYGESGTGKELVAKSIHDLSHRKNGPFIAVNCGAIPENLAESEFFGHKKGAFSGADMDKVGLFESAHDGTLFLDEIGEIPLPLQVKLLRAIEGYGFSPVGTTEVKKSNVRIIAATNRDLKTLVKNGTVRKDFYYRIHIIPIQLPPLKKRKEDIPLLVYHFTRKMNPSGPKRHIPDDVIEKFTTHDWPGNVRELQNTVSRYLAFDNVEFVESGIETSLPDNMTTENGSQKGRNLNSLLAAYERQVIGTAMKEAEGNKSLAARILGIDRRSLHRKISRLDL